MRGLSHSGAHLAKAARELHADWEATAPSWRDHARRDFEDAFVTEFLRAAAAAAGAMEEVDALLRKAIAECS